MIILVGGEKGGTGKSTIATTLAAMRRRRGHDVLLVDADPQGTSRDWADERSDELPKVVCAALRGRNLHGDLRDFANRYDTIVIDAGGRDSPELRASMVVADRLLSPLQPSWADARTLERMEDLVGQAQGINPDLQASVVLTRASTNPHIPELNDAVQLLKDYALLPFSGSVLYDRVAYRRALGLGLCVEEMSDRDTKATVETEILYRYAFEE